MNRLAARIILRLAGIALTVRGLEHLPRAPCVLMANHASYLDGMALFAALPAYFSVVAKREFLDHPVPRIYLRWGHSSSSDSKPGSASRTHGGWRTL